MRMIVGDGLRLTMMMVVVELVSATSNGCTPNSYSNCEGGDYQDGMMINKFKGGGPTPIQSEPQLALQRREFGNSPFGSFGGNFPRNGFPSRSFDDSSRDTFSESPDSNDSSGTRYGNQFDSSSGSDEDRQDNRNNLLGFSDPENIKSDSRSSSSNPFNDHRPSFLTRGTNDYPDNTNFPRSPFSRSDADGNSQPDANLDRSDTTFRRFGSQSNSSNLTSRGLSGLSYSVNPWNPTSNNINPIPDTRTSSITSPRSLDNLTRTQSSFVKVRESDDRTSSARQRHRLLDTSTSSPSTNEVNPYKTGQTELQPQSEMGPSKKHNSMMDRYFPDEKSPTTTKNQYPSSLESRLGGDESDQSLTGSKRSSLENRPSYQPIRGENDNHFRDFDSSARQSNENFRSNNQPHNEKSSNSENHHPRPIITVERISKPNTKTNNNEPRTRNTQPQRGIDPQTTNQYLNSRDISGNYPRTNPNNPRQSNQDNLRTELNHDTPIDLPHSKVGSEAKTSKFEDQTYPLEHPKPQTPVRNLPPRDIRDKPQDRNFPPKDPRGQHQAKTQDRNLPPKYHRGQPQDKTDDPKDRFQNQKNQTDREKTPHPRDHPSKSNSNERDQNTNERCPSAKSSPRPIVKNLASPGLSSTTSVQQLYNEVNRIRQENCLPPLTVSSQLQQTAEAKCQDMDKYFINRPVTEIHDWVGAPYTCSFYSNLDCMEEKPRQLTGYPHKAHEISAWFSGTMNVKYAIDSWIGSSGHFAVLSETGNSNNIGYLQMGACISAHNSNIWFGKPDDQFNPFY